MTSQGMVHNSLKLVRAVDHRCSFFRTLKFVATHIQCTLISGKTTIIVLPPGSTLIFHIYYYTRIYATVNKTVNIVSCNDRTTITKRKLFLTATAPGNLRSWLASGNLRTFTILMLPLSLIEVS